MLIDNTTRRHQCDSCAKSFIKTPMQQRNWIYKKSNLSFCSAKCYYDTLLIDLTGRRFGRLVVLKRDSNKSNITRTSRYWLCKCDCGITKSLLGTNLHQTLSCGCWRSERIKKLSRMQCGKKSPRWKGGYCRYRHVLGYIAVRINGGPCLFEHRIVMEKLLGRPLYKNETVHHINGVRDDNRPENLEVMVGSHPAGISIKDAVAWAREILRRYEATLDTEPLFAEQKISS